MVKLLFKTPTKEQPFELDINPDVVTNVEMLKQKVADHVSSLVPNIKLIHKGTFLLTQARSLRTKSLLSPSKSATAKPSTQSSRRPSPTLLPRHPPSAPNRPAVRLPQAQPPTPTPWAGWEAWVASED